MNTLFFSLACFCAIIFTITLLVDIVIAWIPSLPQSSETTRNRILQMIAMSAGAMMFLKMTEYGF